MSRRYIAALIVGCRRYPHCGAGLGEWLKLTLTPKGDAAQVDRNRHAI